MSTLSQYLRKKNQLVLWWFALATVGNNYWLREAPSCISKEYAQVGQKPSNFYNIFPGMISSQHREKSVLEVVK